MTVATDLIRKNPMSRLQVVAVAICLLINFIDGFDVLAIAFAAPEIAREWGVTPAQLGLIFSSGVAGMVLGALFLSPLGDRWGRRPLILLCLAVITMGMLASAGAQDSMQLVLARLVTGIGVGSMLPSLTTMVAEYSNDRYRQWAISILQSGYPVGAILAGFVAAWMLPIAGWRALFLVGGVLSFLMIPVVLWRLPESVSFLETRQPANALERLNRILVSMRMEPIGALPEVRAHQAGGRSARRVLSAELRTATLSIWLAYIVLMSAFYFATNWTPKVLTDAGLSLNAGISGGVLMATGGVIGGLILGALSNRWSIYRIGVIYMALGTVSLIVFGLLHASPSTMLPAAFFIGFFLAGSIICLYAIVPDLYPAAIRNSGVGWALGIGRFGAVIGPWLAGVLIGFEWQRPAIYMVMALPVVLGMIVIHRLSKSRPQPGAV